MTIDYITLLKLFLFHYDFISLDLTDMMHPWELFLEYYDMKNGARLAKNPSRMLSRAFNLEDLASAGDESRTRMYVLFC